MRFRLDEVPLLKVCRVIEAPSDALRLQELGLSPGRELRVLRRGFAGGALVLAIDGSRRCVRRREARRCWVDTL